MIVTIKRNAEPPAPPPAVQIVIDDLTIKEARVLQRLMLSNVSVPDLLMRHGALKGDEGPLLTRLMGDLAEALINHFGGGLKTDVG